MLDKLIERVEAQLAPYARAISVCGVIWFWLGVAIQARFIPLPDIPRDLELAFFWTGIAFNAIWWGVLRPAIERRRKDAPIISKGTAPVDPA